MKSPPGADKGSRGRAPCRLFPPASTKVIRLTRLNGNGLTLNSDLIKFVEKSPDTVITLTNGEKVIVREAEDEVIRRVLEFRRSLVAHPASVPDAPANGDASVNPVNRYREDPRRG